MRSIKKTTLSFGAVNVNVKLYTATEKHGVQFHQYHGAHKCYGPINYRRVCGECGEAVEYSDIVKGTMVDDALVAVTPDEIKTLDEENDAIEVVEFVDANEIDPVLFSGATYFLDADGGGSRTKRENPGPARSYALLRRALVESGKVGVVRFALRQRGTTGVLRVIDRPDGPPVLAIHTLLWADEVRDTHELTGASKVVELSDKEVAMAHSFIEAYAGTWDPTSYTDEYNARTLELVAAKAAGGEFEALEADGGEVADGSDVSDMMAKLEASIKAREAQKQEVDAAVGRHPAGRKRAPQKAAPQKAAPKPAARKAPAAAPKRAARKSA